MKSIMRLTVVLPVLGALTAWLHPAEGRAQARVDIGGQLIAVFHRIDPTAEARPASAWQVVQPMVTASARLGRGFGARATVNLEGLTMPRGELTPGAWGEGFVDRRHPHTYAHELIVDAVRAVACGARLQCRLGGFVGKGFVPFGSEDPMSRPFLRYPVNHHLAQILERAVAGVQLKIGPGLLEGSLFNGDEPERPGQWPRIKGRFGDSWSLRATLRHRDAAELAVSLAGVASPEHRPGAGSTQKKRHVGGTLRPDTRLELFGEWARTSELDGFFVFDSWLAEAVWRAERVRIQYRFESTDRPEEERLSPYRSARPHLENSILGITRWTSHTFGATVPVRRFLHRGCIVAFGEATAGRVRSTVRGAFDPVATYGKTGFASVSLGVKLAWAGHGTMGRYGLAAAVRHLDACH